jgi:hypothetical protein
MRGSSQQRIPSGRLATPMTQFRLLCRLVLLESINTGWPLSLLCFPPWGCHLTELTIHLQGSADGKCVVVELVPPRPYLRASIPSLPRLAGRVPGEHLSCR